MSLSFAEQSKKPPRPGGFFVMGIFNLFAMPVDNPSHLF
jgi:hypothetical protein